MNEEKYEEFVNFTCEMLGLNKPIDILKLCQLTSDFIRPYEMKIKELKEENEELRLKWLQATDEGTSWARLKNLETENEKLKAQIEKMKCCYNCEGYIDDDAYDLCKICNEYSEWELEE